MFIEPNPTLDPDPTKIPTPEPKLKDFERGHGVHGGPLHKGGILQGSTVVHYYTKICINVISSLIIRTNICVFLQENVVYILLFI